MIVPAEGGGMKLYPTPENPSPPSAECQHVITRDKIRLRAMKAVPLDVRGTVVIIGGRGDFLERYFETMEDLMARGFAVASVDLRGQGGSQRLSDEIYRGPVRSFADFDEDVRAFMEDVVLPHCPAPYFALGHSTGGHVLLRVLRDKKWFKKAVLVAPLVDVLYGVWPRALAAALVSTVVACGLGGMFLPGAMKHPMGREHFTGNPLTSDEWRWNRDSGTLEAAPNLGLGGATFSWLHAARRSMASVARMKKSPVPILIISSGMDHVVSNDAIWRLARRVPGISLVSIPGAQHEILTENDAVRRQFLAAFDSFVTSSA